MGQNVQRVCLQQKIIRPKIGVKGRGHRQAAQAVAVIVVLGFHFLRQIGKVQPCAGTIRQAKGGGGEIKRVSQISAGSRICRRF